MKKTIAIILTILSTAFAEAAEKFVMKGVSYVRKQQNITFRVTEDEFKMIKEKAISLNLTMTDFIVKCCQEKEVVPTKK